MDQTVTIRIAAASHQNTALQTMCFRDGRARAIDEVPRHRPGAPRTFVRFRTSNDDTPVKTRSSARFEPAHAFSLAPHGACLIADAAVFRSSPRRIAHAAA